MSTKGDYVLHSAKSAAYADAVWTSVKTMLQSDLFSDDQITLDCVVKLYAYFEYVLSDILQMSPDIITLVRTYSEPYYTDLNVKNVTIQNFFSLVDSFQTDLRSHADSFPSTKAPFDQPIVIAARFCCQTLGVDTTFGPLELTAVTAEFSKLIAAVATPAESARRNRTIPASTKTSKKRPRAFFPLLLFCTILFTATLSVGLTLYFVNSEPAVETTSAVINKYENLEGIVCDVEWEFVFSDSKIEAYNKSNSSGTLLPDAVQCVIHVKNNQSIARSVDISIVGHDKKGNPAYLDYTFSGVILPNNSADVQHEIPINRFGEVNSRIVYTDLVDITAFPEFSNLEDDELSELKLYQP